MSSMADFPPTPCAQFVYVFEAVGRIQETKHPSRSYLGESARVEGVAKRGHEQSDILAQLSPFLRRHCGRNKHTMGSLEAARAVVVKGRFLRARG